MTTGIRNLKKAGVGWTYDEPEIEYDAEIDPKTGLPVTYNSLGTEPVITNLDKSNLQ